MCVRHVSNQELHVPYVCNRAGSSHGGGAENTAKRSRPLEIGRAARYISTDWQLRVAPAGVAPERTQHRHHAVGVGKQIRSRGLVANLPHLGAAETLVR